MLAMKLMALRIEPGSDRNDLEDILNLMQVTCLKEKGDIVEFAARFYPEARTSGRLMLSVDDLWSEYRRRLQRPAHEPPQYLGRSGPES
jgi:hypothetical protein